MTHSSHRNGDAVTVYIDDGRRNTERNAREIAQRSLEPWEVLASDKGETYGGWRFTVDVERSARRKSVLDTLLCEMDATDANYAPGDEPGEDLPPVEWYLADIATLIERIEDGEVRLRD